MAGNSELTITLGPRRQITARVGGFEVRTDQPVSNGGDGEAPSPFQLFLASMGTCAGIFVQGFCAKRDIPYEDIRILERPHYDEAGTMIAVELEVVLPPGFPEKYKDAILKVVDGCSVKKAILARPEFRVSARLAETATAAS